MEKLILYRFTKTDDKQYVHYWRLVLLLQMCNKIISECLVLACFIYDTICTLFVQKNIYFLNQSCLKPPEFAKKCSRYGAQDFFKILIDFFELIYI